VTITPKNIYKSLKEQSTIFIHTHLIWGLWLEFGPGWGVRVRVGVRM